MYYYTNPCMHIYIYTYTGVIAFQNDDGANAIATVACFLFYSIYYYLYARKRQKISPEEKVFFPVNTFLYMCMKIYA
jgi:hypothetical protein